MHVTHKTLPQYQIDFTQNFDTTFTSLQQTESSEENSSNHQYGFDPHWEDRLYDQDNLEYCHNYGKPIEQTEVNDTVDDSHLSDELRHALRDQRTKILQWPGTSPLAHFTLFPFEQTRTTTSHRQWNCPTIEINPGWNRKIPTTFDKPSL